MKYILFIGAAMLLPALTFAKNEKKLHYGISLGVQQSAFEVSRYNHSYYKSVDLNAGTGFRLGLLASYKIKKNLSVNLKPEMAFYGNTLNTVRVDNNTAHWEMAPIAELAADIRYKANLKIAQPYVYAGAGYGKQLSRIDVTASDGLLKYNFAAAQLGIGVEKKIKSVIVAPELRFSRSLTYAGGVCNMAGMNMHTVAFILNFKGI